ncbi:MAG: hypothetical protein ACREOK_03640 [Gemmatimonadaceae bacterium]
MKLSVALLIGVVAFGTPGALEAQAGGRGRGQEKGRNDDIPRNMRPPAGMCRIWLDDVPAAQQPAPTDCASAVRNRPAKGRVVFGDDFVDAKTKRPDSTGRTTKTTPPVKGFAPGKSPTKKKPSFPLRRP